MVARNGSLPKIFVVGFNKCATTSLHKLFEASGIRSLHYGSRIPGENAAVAIQRNLMLCRPALHGLESYEAFSDLTFYGTETIVEGSRYYRELHREHPDSYFILNVRSVDAWLRSRFNHGKLAKRACRVLACTEEELSQIWRHQFLAHNAEVEQYFTQHNSAFLRFDIDNDGAEKLADFLAPTFRIDTTAWGVHLKTVVKPKRFAMGFGFSARSH